MQHRTKALTAAVGALALTTALSARADLIFGGNARATAMGGAGIAIVERSERATTENPATLALQNRGVQTGFPGIGLHASGIPLDKAFSHLTGNPDQNDAVGLARDFGRRESDFGVGLSWGIRIAHMDVRAMGIGTVRIIPNASLEAWASSANGNTALLTGAERADILGAAIYSLPTIGVAERVSPKGSPTRVEAGLRIKLMRAIYTHYIVDANSLLNNTPAATAPELNGGTTLTKDGLGIDFGLLAHPRDHTGFSGALVCTNLIAPPFQFNGTDTSGGSYRYDLQPRSVSLGTAYESGRTLFAADLVDLSRAYGNVQFRFGGEYASRHTAIRAGYSSARGFTIGVGFGSLDFAFGAKAPLGISETLRF